MVFSGFGEKIMKVSEEKHSKMSDLEGKMRIQTAVWCLGKMRYSVQQIKGTDYYMLLDSDGKNIFGYGFRIPEIALIEFADRAFRFKRRNGLKKLRDEIPVIVEQIKNNRWLCSE